MIPSAAPLTVLLAFMEGVPPPSFELALKAAGLAVQEVTSEHHLSEVLRHFTPAVVVLHTGNASLERVCQRLRSVATVPIIALLPDTPDALDLAVRAGADDSLPVSTTAEMLAWRVRWRLATHTQSPKKLRSSPFDFVDDAAFLVDAHSGLIIDVNRRASKLTGYTRGELLTMPYNALQVSQQPDTPAREMTTKGHLLYEMGLRTRTGNVIPVEISSRTIDQGGDAALLCLMRDIRIRKATEQAAHQQRHLAEALSDTAALLNSTLNTDEIIHRVLAHIGRVLPSPTANIMLVTGTRVHIIGHMGFQWFKHNPAWTTTGLDIVQLSALHWMHTHRQPLLLANTSESPLWSYNDDTDWVHAYLGAPIITNGTVLGFINLDADVPHFFSEQQKQYLAAFASQVGIALRNAQLYALSQSHIAERTAELEAERAQLQAILDGMTEGVILFSAEDSPLYVNPSFTHLTGITVSDWDAAAPHFFVAAPESTPLSFATIQQAVQRDGLWRGEARIRHRSGEVFDASLVASGVHSSGHAEESRTGGTAAHETPHGTVLVIRDISQEKRLESQKSRFIATASHELRTPLANIKTRVYLLSRQPEKLDDHLPILRTVTDRMHTLIEHLLDISRFENGIITLHRQPVLLQALLEEELRVHETDAQAKQIALSHTFAAAPLYALVDEDRIKQVMTNLLHNAINYTPEGGAINVVLQRDDFGRAVIAIEDTGIGISEELLPNIFQPFVRGSDFTHGTGLGLSISREIVELHGGEIRVVSEEGKGTCFSVYLELLHMP